MEMTPHQQQAEALFEEFMGKPDDNTLGTEYVRKDLTIAFAAFCLEKREEQTTDAIKNELKLIGNYFDVGTLESSEQKHYIRFTSILKDRFDYYNKP